MSQLKPFFITGSNVKIKVNDKTMAYCTDFSCTVQVITQTPKVLGKFEGSSVEPLGYSVSGSFALIRYAKNATSEYGGRTPNGASNYGNGSGSWGNGDGTGVIGSATDIQLNPADLANGSTFDIEVYQKIEPVLGKKDNLGLIKIRNARLTRADFSISKKSVAIERFDFTALYVDYDSFRADFSGSPISEIR